MASSSPRHSSDRSAALLIGCGLSLIVLAQLFDGVPVAAAIAVIAWGALQLLQSRDAGSLAVAVNFVIYAMLVAGAIGSQTHATMTINGGKMTLPVLMDQALAITLLVALLFSSCGSEATEDA